MYLPAAGTCAGRQSVPAPTGTHTYTHAPMSERWRELESRTRFEPAEVEPRITERWLASGLFHPEPEGDAGENYSIAIPPPNVTGSLHMGHALNGSVQDVLIRYHRMAGRRTKWILGTDHAGIATQAQVEKALRAEGTNRHELGREEFVRRVWEWREHYGHTIVEQFKRLGASCDYSEERFTLDEGYHRAVVEVFVALYEQGLIYRDRYIVNWDPGSRSAISDLEVEERRETDTLYSIRYDLEGGAAGQGPGSRAPRSSDLGGGSVTIATVRPETMLGDTAVAVHPEDERYRELVGRTAVLPLVGRHLPIVADDYVKRDFGTGQLKVTPAHDPADFEIGQRHELDQVSVIGEDGRLTSEAGERFAGLTVMEARAAVVAALRAEGRVVAEESYEHEVPYSHRSGARIEPLISLQWFMRMDTLAAPAIEAVREGRVRIVPENHRRVYLDWMESIRPWCLSRQLWWGHRLPVYYCEPCGHVHVAAVAPERCELCGGELRQDEDVLDTWFSSALWPFATLGWPEETAQLRAFYPTNVLSTARDILFLWVARMIMMGLRFTGEVPFTEVYIHSVIQAPDGRRMSKSLGTGIDPLDEIASHGADAVRFGLLAMSSSQDVRYSAEKVRQGQALANKLFNAARFALLRIAGMDRDPAHPVRPGGARGSGVGPGAGGERVRADRGPLDPLAPAAGQGRHSGADRGLRLLPRRAWVVRLRLRGAVRLVPGDRQAAVGGRRPWRERRGGAAGEQRRPRGACRDAVARAARDGRAGSSGDPVRDGGAVGFSRRLGRAARGLPLPASRREATRPRGGDRGGARDRGGHARAGLAGLRERATREGRACSSQRQGVRVHRGDPRRPGAPRVHGVRGIRGVRGCRAGGVDLGAVRDCRGALGRGSGSCGG